MSSLSSIPPEYSVISGIISSGSSNIPPLQQDPPQYPISKIINDKLYFKQEKRIEYLNCLDDKVTIAKEALQTAQEVYNSAVNFAKQERIRIEKIHNNEKRKLTAKTAIIKKKRELNLLHKAELERRRLKMAEIRQQREELDLYDTISQLQNNQNPHLDGMEY